MSNTVQVHIKPCDRDYSGSYCFPCVSGLCPYNADFSRDCYPNLDYEMQEFFEELFLLRMNSGTKKPDFSTPPLKQLIR